MTQSDFDFYPEQIRALEKRLTMSVRLGAESDSGFYNLAHALKDDIKVLREMVNTDALKSKTPASYTPFKEWLERLETTRADTYLKYSRERRFI